MSVILFSLLVLLPTKFKLANVGIPKMPNNK